MAKYRPVANCRHLHLNAMPQLCISCQGCWGGLSTSYYIGSKQTQELLGRAKFQGSLLQPGAGVQVSILEQRCGCRHTRGGHVPRSTDPAHIPADIQHPPDRVLSPRGWNGGEHFTPSVLVEISSSLQLPFISASDSAGPEGLTSAPRWAPSKKRFMVKSAPRLCCAACA